MNYTSVEYISKKMFCDKTAEKLERDLFDLKNWGKIEGYACRIVKNIEEAIDEMLAHEEEDIREKCKEYPFIFLIVTYQPNDENNKIPSEIEGLATKYDLRKFEIPCRK